MEKIQQKLSVSMIVKNEESCLSACLASIKGADEIVIVDTGSTDRTIEVARTLGAIILSGSDYAWSDDFSKSRNQALDHCTGDWVLSIDADEVLEPGGIDKIRVAIENTGEYRTLFVQMKAQGTGYIHRLARLFRNVPGVSWQGIAHEAIIPQESYQYDHPTDVVITYGSSSAHAADPDRMLRILTKAVELEPGVPRNLYYLAREYWYRNVWDSAAFLYEKYLFIATWLPEIADAKLMLARCYWNTNRGNEARTMCLKAILDNPQFCEALSFMSELYFEPWSHKWKQLASVATNEDVLFVR